MRHPTTLRVKSKVHYISLWKRSRSLEGMALLHEKPKLTPNYHEDPQRKQKAGLPLKEWWYTSGHLRNQLGGQPVHSPTIVKSKFPSVPFEIPEVKNQKLCLA
jgi:hypothetical protein